MFQSGLGQFKVVLGDSNLQVGWHTCLDRNIKLLQLELPYGVQELGIRKALVHEDYNTEDQFHHHDIGRTETILGKCVSNRLKKYRP